MRTNVWLIAGGVLSALAAVLHLAIIFGGPAWYRFFHAGEPMARAAEQGSPGPALVTTGIAAVLFVWSAYAFAGAGLVRPLPLMRTALVLISAAYLFRALWLPAALVGGAGRRLPVVELADRAGLRRRLRARHVAGLAGADPAGLGCGPDVEAPVISRHPRAQRSEAQLRPEDPAERAISARAAGSDDRDG